MSAVGPELPPHLFEKRKRPEDDDASDSRSDSSQSSSLKSSSKRQRTIGPTLPPAPLDERPPSSSQPSPGPATKAEDTSSDDDEFGPVLPTSGNAEDATSSSIPRLSASADPAPPAPSQRDAWMLVPPSSGDWSARIDPTKLKARKFNTSKSSSGPKDTSSSAADTWNETPQEKHARLQREMMGIKDPSTGSVTSKSFKHQSKKDKTEDATDAETKKRLKDYTAARGPSLYNSHQKKDTVEKDDDPSARAFDREKDVGGGLQINGTQRRDLLKKAGDFSSRFSSAKYL